MDIDYAIQHVLDASRRRVACDQRYDVLDVLQRRGFLDDDAPITDLAAGPSPHVGWGLAHRLENGKLYFVEWRAEWLGVHKGLYEQITRTDAALATRSLQAHWLLANAQTEPHILAGKTAIVHGDLPRLVRDGRAVLPYEPDDMKATLAGLLDAQPRRLALYLREDTPRYPDSASNVTCALAALGVNYSLVADVESADFVPRRGGYLVTISN